MSWRDTFSAFPQDDEDDDFGDNDDDADDFKKSERQRDAVLWVIDCQPNMLENLDLPQPKKKKKAKSADAQADQPPTAPDPVPKDVETPVSSALWLSATLMKQKIVSAPADVVGVLLINVTPASPAAYPPRDALSRNYQGIVEIADLDVPDAPRILKMEEMAKSAGGDSAKFRDEFRSHAAKMEEVFWTAQDVFSRAGAAASFSTRRIFFVTKDDHMALDAAQRSVIIKRAEDLKNQGMTVYPFLFERDPPTSFRWDFWKELIQTFAEPDEDPRDWKPPDAITSFEQMKDEVRKRDFPKRTAFRVDWTIAEGVLIAVAGYNLVVEQKRPNHVLVDRFQNKQVHPNTAWYDMDTDQPLLATEGTLKYAYEYGGKRVVFTKEEMDKIRLFKDHDVSKPGIRTLGFKSSSALGAYHWKNTIRHSMLLYPDEAEIKGSMSLFATLLNRLKERDMVAICSFVPRRNAPLRLVALVPQIEYRDRHQDRPAGFQIHPLPFADDIRTIDLPYVPDLEVVDRTIGSLSAALGKINTKRYLPASFANPVLQRHYMMVETVALDRDLKNIEMEDNTLPNHRLVDRAAGPSIREFKEKLAEELGNFPTPEEPPKPAKGKKRAVPRDEGEEDGDEGETPKKKRVQKPPASLDEVEEAAREGKLAKMTVASLTAYLRGKRVTGTLPRKKDDLLSLVEIQLAADT
ncbi:Ku DNA-binding complex, Ku70 subunit [Gonapodya prolifera JEL478]|uniref:ATP-dependent DNA helicase II subunit 1 n=1 Tax=Gonapodya prolifera (strain JEL478) TaxID=1344416 RepID=A0A139APJ4_GONPJ|nr:Ku DNA-binding complex, Ku70 subunit [Gonapodya prolifera JEL478]|eukprot:KXS18670.1 Ku DNA-binding complex, Ku70 subunit [Gonapodya prolifera JEL478]